MNSTTEFFVALPQKMNHAKYNQIIQESNLELITVGELFNYSREAMGMKRKDLVELTGFSASTLRRFERGQRIRQFNYMVRLYKLALIHHAHQCGFQKRRLPDVWKEKRSLEDIIYKIKTYPIYRPYIYLGRVAMDCNQILCIATNYSGDWSPMAA